MGKHLWVLPGALGSGSRGWRWGGEQHPHGACRCRQPRRPPPPHPGRELKKQPPPRPTAPKPALPKKLPELEGAGGLDVGNLPPLGSLVLPELPEELRKLPSDVLAGHLARLPPPALAALTLNPALAPSPRPPEPFMPVAGLASAPLPPFAPARFPGTLPGHYRLPAAPAAVPGPFPPQLLQPSAPQATGALPASSPAAPQLFPAATVLRAPGQPGTAAGQPGFVGPHVLPPRSSPQHGASLPSSAPAPSYGLGQPGVPTPGPLRPPTLGPAPMGGPEPVPGPQPATTTVDSVQAPISSCTAPPRLPSQGPFLAPQHPGAPPTPFPYAQGGLQPFGQPAQHPAQHPFPAGQPPPAFTPATQLQPAVEMPARAQGPQSFPPAPFLPPGRAQVPLPFHQLPPQPQFAQFAGPPGQPPQLYQVPGQDKLHPQGLAPQPGSLPFPRPPGQPLHAAALGGLQPVPASSPALPFCPSPAPPGAMGSALPTPASQAGPHHVTPSASPGLSQLQGTVVVQGPLIPSPAPSPQPPLPVQPPGSSNVVPQRPLAESPFQRQSSTTDDLLSSSPESQHGGSKAPVGQPLLQPTKADASEGQKPRALQLIESDPYEKPERVLRLLAELERFRGVVEGLEQPVPGGGGAELDVVWKELQEAQERDARQLSIAIARCYSMKNRHQDIMPYDRNRVVLRSGKDDYINASRVEDLSPYCPAVIATQAPLLGTAADFWLMIYEQKVSVIVMLVSEQELDKVGPGLRRDRRGRGGSPGRWGCGVGW